MYGTKRVSKNNILEKINSFDIFKKYVDNFDEVGKKFCSSLREDKSPTCCIVRIGDDLRYRDFTETRSIDCFEYVCRKYNVNYYTALEMINLDFNLGLIPNFIINYTPTASATYKVDITSLPKRSTEIAIVRRNWNHLDKNFWNKKYQLSSKRLEEYNIFPISGFFLNGIYITAEPLSYAYYFGEAEDGRSLYKIYQPFSKSLKWLTNCPQDYFQGEDQLPPSGDLLIITKSLKDVVVLKEAGYNAIAPQGETVLLTVEKVISLKERFTTIVFLYDNDSAGITAVGNLSNLYNIPYFVFPIGTKDASDFVEQHGYILLQNFINEQLEILCKDTKLAR